MQTRRTKRHGLTLLGCEEDDRVRGLLQRDSRQLLMTANIWRKVLVLYSIWIMFRQAEADDGSSLIPDLQGFDFARSD